MESKKINQLATELTPALSDLTIIGDPSTGISKKITLSQMASLFTGTVEEYPNLASFPLVGVADTIYIALDTNVLYRWDTTLTSYVELSPNIINSLVFNDANGFDGTINLVGSVATLTITTALTTGSVGFIGASGALLQDNANFFWDDTNNRLGIGTNTPTTAIDVFGSGIIGRLNGTSTNNAFLCFASAGSNKWSIGNVQSDHRFRIYNEATTSELVSVLSTGEFGIGIANPTTKFHIDGAASALIANLDANVSIAKSVSFRSDNSARFNIEVSGTESGSNAGANFFIRRYSDAGSLIDTPVTITRSTGAITLAGTLNGTIANFNGAISSDQTDGGIFYTKTAGALVGLLTNTFQISGSGTKIDLNAYVYGANSFGVWTNATKRLTIDGTTGNATFSSIVSASQFTNTNQLAFLLNNGGVNNDFRLGTSSSQFRIVNSANTVGLLTITDTGVTAFSNSITAGDANGIVLYGRYNNGFPGSGIGYFSLNAVVQDAVNGGIAIKTLNSGTLNTALSITATGAATFSTNVGIGMTPITGNGGLQIGYSGGAAPSIYFTKGTTAAYFGVDAYGTDIFGGGTTGPFPFTFVTNSTERMRITSGGNVLINTITNNGFNLEVNGTIRTGMISSQNGSILTNTNVATTLFTVNSYGLWIVYADVPAGSGSPANYSSYAIISHDGSVARILQQTDGLNMFLTLSGNNIQGRQTSGGQFNIRFVYQRIGY